MTKLVYIFDELTGELLTAYMANASPLEPGKYLEPIHSTTVEPPEELPDTTRHFIAGVWEYRDVPKLAALDE